MGVMGGTFLMEYTWIKGGYFRWSINGGTLVREEDGRREFHIDHRFISQGIHLHWYETLKVYTR